MSHHNGYSDYLDTGDKTYYVKDGEIISQYKDGFGGVITHKYNMDNIWPQLHDIFRAGRRHKANELKRALESF